MKKILSQTISVFCYWLKREHNSTYIPQLNTVELNMKRMASIYFTHSTRSVLKFCTINAKNKSYLWIRFLFTYRNDSLSICMGEWGLDEFIFSNDLADNDKQLYWPYRLSSGQPDYRQRMGFACQQMGFVLCLSYPCWRTVPRDLEGGGGLLSTPIYKSTNHRHCHRGKVREADTCTTPGVRMSLLISYRLHTQNWMLYLSVFVLGAPCDKSLPSIPGMFKLLRLGTPPPTTYSYLFIQVCLPCSSHVYVQAAVGLRLKGLLVFHDFPTDNLYLLIICTSLRFEA